MLTLIIRFCQMCAVTGSKSKMKAESDEKYATLGGLSHTGLCAWKTM